MSHSKLARNMLSEADSLSGVLRHQCGDGAGALAQAASLLRSNKRIILTGMGASLFASMSLEYSLCEQGIDATAIEAGELLHCRHASARDAVLVIVSRSGESIEITRLLQLLRGRTPVVGICNEPASTLALNADVGILVGSSDDDYVAVQTYTGTLLTLFLLASEVAGTQTAALEIVDTLLPAFSSLVQNNFDERHRWDNFFTGSPTYLLGRGPSFASAHAGALLFHEVAKAPAVAMAAASFRHGPVEVVNAQFRALVFAPQGGTRELNLALARDLTGFGGRTRIIGPALPATPVECCEIPAAPETLAPIFEIVPVQAAALRLAELRGIAPGTFRFAPRVAVDEAGFPSRKES